MDQETQLNRLREQEKTLSKTLLASPTAFGGETDPSSSDTSSQARINRIRDQITKINDETRRKKWYGPEGQADKETEGSGFIGKALDTLATPARGVVGAVEYATGKNVAPTLAGNIAENIKTGHRTFGDLLKRENIPWLVSAPVGFALDVALDPVNWATAGTTALVPRVASGFVKGTKVGGIKAGLQAAATGARSSWIGGTAAKGVSKLSKTPFLGDDISSKLSQVRLGTAEAASKYDELVGRDFLNNTVSKGGTGVFSGSDYRIRLGDLVEAAAEKLPGGKSIFKQFNYSNKEWMRLAKLKDSLQQKLGMTDEFNAAVRAHLNGEDITPYLNKARERIEKVGKIDLPIETDINPQGVLDDDLYEEFIKTHHGGKLADSADDIVRETEDAAEILTNPSLGTTFDTAENAWRLTAEDFNKTLNSVDMDDLKTLVKSSMDETGVAWYDNMISKVNSLKFKVKSKEGEEKIINYGEKALEGYKFFNNIFKRAKIGASPTAWTNAILGNPTMAWMAGLDVFSPQYMGRVKNAAGVVIGTKKSDATIQKMMNFGEMRRFMEENPTTFGRTVGESPKYFQSRAALQTVLKKGRDAGYFEKNVDKTEVAELLSKTGEDLAPEIERIILEMGQSPETAYALGKVVDDIPRASMGRPSEYTKNILGDGTPLTSTDLPTGMTANELYDSQVADKVFAYIKKRADEGNPGYKLLNLTFNRATSAYEGIDQTYKLGTIMYATMDGLTEKELNIVRRSVDFTAEDIAKMSKVNDNGVWRYRLSADKATELANEVYLNYNAMPGAVKVMRNFPILGSPFFSFTYGMAAKTINTAVTNPAVFNKVNFALNDYGGMETPLQKKGSE